MFHRFLITTSKSVRTGKCMRVFPRQSPSRRLIFHGTHMSKYWCLFPARICMRHKQQKQQQTRLDFSLGMTQRWNIFCAVCRCVRVCECVAFFFFCVLPALLGSDLRPDRCCAGLGWACVACEIISCSNDNFYNSFFCFPFSLFP